VADLVLRFEGVSKRFGGIQALSALSFDVRGGEILGVIGPNGAGKSVMINVASGIYPADEGRVVHRQRDITGLSAHQRGRAGIARTFQNIRLFKRMTVLENVLVADKTHVRRPFGSLLSFGRRKAEIAAGLAELDRMRLADKADQLAGTLAYGDARRLEIARALAGNPSVLFLDEPAAGMNEREMEELLIDIRACRSRLDAIVVVEHDMALLRVLSDRLVAMNYGQRIAEGTPDEVLAHPEVVSAYLGTADV
jgi:branched-chain amino acid transport system ATP-binding protein